MTPRNEHLSFSRLKRYAQCPWSYARHYVDKSPSVANDALRFGSLLHQALESTYRTSASATGEAATTNRFPDAELVAAFRQGWAASGLTDFGTFEEGLGILKDYARQHAELDPKSVLAVEQEFRLTIGRFTVLGYIDRVDRLGEDTVGVVDYKSNRTIFTREEVDHDLQLSIYAMAARVLWPWARHVRLGFYLLRHGIHMATERSDEQLAAAREYIEMLGEEIESATSFPARLNENCAYCDHRAGCPTYHRALLGKVELVCRSTDDLEAVAREREEVARTAKVLYARKDELERLLKARLEHVGRLELGGMVYTLGKTTQLSYPTAPTVAVLASALGRAEEDVAPLLLCVDKTKVDALVKEAARTMAPAEVRLLRARLEAVADKTVSPRFSAQRAAATGGAS